MFKHNGNGDFGEVSVTERCCAALISNIERHMERFSYDLEKWFL